MSGRCDAVYEVEHPVQLPAKHPPEQQGHTVPEQPASSANRRAADGAVGGQGTDLDPEYLWIWSIKSKPLRIAFMCSLFAAFCPILLLGHQLDLAARHLPGKLPPVRWSFTQEFNLGNSIIPKSGLADVSSGKSEAVSSKLGALSQQAQASLQDQFSASEQAAMQEKFSISRHKVEEAGRRSIWSFGPFLISVGLLVTFLLKLIFAQPCAKWGTDFFYAQAKSQLQADSERGPTDDSASGHDAGSARSSSKSSGAMRESQGSEKGKKWSVTLDLPDGGGQGSSRGVASTALHEPIQVPDDIHPALKEAATRDNVYGSLLRDELKRSSPGRDQQLAK